MAKDRPKEEEAMVNLTSPLLPAIQKNSVFFLEITTISLLPLCLNPSAPQKDTVQLRPLYCTVPSRLRGKKTQQNTALRLSFVS